MNNIYLNLKVGVGSWEDHRDTAYLLLLFVIHWSCLPPSFSPPYSLPPPSLFWACLTLNGHQKAKLFFLSSPIICASCGVSSAIPQLSMILLGNSAACPYELTCTWTFLAVCVTSASWKVLASRWEESRGHGGERWKWCQVHFCSSLSK